MPERVHPSLVEVIVAGVGRQPPLAEFQQGPVAAEALQLLDLAREQLSVAGVGGERHLPAGERPLVVARPRVRQPLERHGFPVSGARPERPVKEIERLAPLVPLHAKHPLGAEQVIVERVAP